jgi:hypothetical protein
LLYVVQCHLAALSFAHWVCCWLYTIYVAVYGNFKQDHFFCKHGWCDLPLLAGLAFMILPTPFNKWVLEHTNELKVHPMNLHETHNLTCLAQQIGTCSAFATICNSGMCQFKGEVASGVMGCVCSWHELRCKQGMETLHKGETWVYLLACPIGLSLML